MNAASWTIEAGSWSGMRSGDRVVMVDDGTRIAIFRPGQNIGGVVDAARTRIVRNPMAGLTTVDNRTAGLSLTLRPGGDASASAIDEAATLLQDREVEEAEAPHVSVRCGECGAEGAARAIATSFACDGCGGRFDLRRCATCGNIVHVDATSWSASPSCPACARSGSRAVWSPGNVTAGEAAKAAGIIDQTPDPGRRIVPGIVASATGAGGVADGAPCVVAFERAGLSVVAAGQNDEPRLVLELAWTDVRRVEVGGAGIVSTTRGGGWGGIGLSAIVLAGALNALTTRTNTTIETLLSVEGGESEVVVYTNAVTPEVLRVRLAPIRGRIAMARRALDRTAGDGRLARLAVLGDLADRGLLTANEFELEKARILAAPLDAGTTAATPALVPAD